MLDQEKVSNLITFFNEELDEIRKHSSDAEMDAFLYYFNNFLECIKCDPVVEDDHLVDIVDW